jgi:hypothetical protein
MQSTISCLRCWGDLLGFLTTPAISKINLALLQAMDLELLYTVYASTFLYGQVGNARGTIAPKARLQRNSRVVGFWAARRLTRTCRDTFSTARQSTLIVH